MQLTLDPESFAPIIAATVAATLAQIKADNERFGEEIAFDEPKAARLLNIEHHVLRDTRLRGEISASRIVGRRIRYCREDLMAYLAKNRIQARD